MKHITSPEYKELARAAAGAFSFRMDGLRLTTSFVDKDPITFCASTYNAMMARGWAPEVIHG